MLKKVPHTYVIIFYIIIIAAILTWIIPGGEYTENTTVENGIEKKVYEFQYTDNVKQTWQIFAALFKGFERQAGIIVFIIMIGGAFWIMNSSKAVDVGILSFLRFIKRIEHNRILKFLGVNNIILTLIMLMFSIFGAVFGMSEETIAFIIVLVPLAISMGYDSFTGVSIVFIAAGLGFAGAVLNPFTIGIAQEIAGLPLFSGIEYRILCWFVINVIGIVFILRYANRIKRLPQRSLVYREDEYWREKGKADVSTVKYYTPVSAWISYILILLTLIVFSVCYPVTEIKIGNSPGSLNISIIPICTLLFALAGILSLKKSFHFFILSILLFTILFLIVGVIGYSWDIMKIASLFFAMGIMSGIALNKSPNNIVKLFLDGVKDILPAALVVGLAGGIIVILEEGQIIDTILYSLSGSMENFGKIASIGMMYVIQTIFNIAVPSGSAKAAITMPILAPFSDLINISRQATVMAYQFGDGFTNMITPTSGVLIGVLGVARIPYEKWVRWIAPLILVMIILGFIMLIPTVAMELKGF
ncbi:MAG: AbgT family transporter [Bacteroidales bacterium]|nr:MAG: AbgT family transporter [Bacteroidales bacterium]